MYFRIPSKAGATDFRLPFFGVVVGLEDVAFVLPFFSEPMDPADAMPPTPAVVAVAEDAVLALEYLEARGT